MRVLFALPGLHRVQRGAEVAFEAVAHELALSGRDEVHLFGSGQPRADRAYRFHRVPALPREYFERMPTGPLLRSEYAYEVLCRSALVGHTAHARRPDCHVWISVHQLDPAESRRRPIATRPHLRHAKRRLARAKHPIGVPLLLV
jgi:hypothetical protein